MSGSSLAPSSIDPLRGVWGPVTPGTKVHSCLECPFAMIGPTGRMRITVLKRHWRRFHDVGGHEYRPRSFEPKERRRFWYLRNRARTISRSMIWKVLHPEADLFRQETKRQEFARWYRRKMRDPEYRRAHAARTRAWWWRTREARLAYERGRVHAASRLRAEEKRVAVRKLRRRQARQALPRDHPINLLHDENGRWRRGHPDLRSAEERRVQMLRSWARLSPEQREARIAKVVATRTANGTWPPKPPNGVRFPVQGPPRNREGELR